MNRSTYSTPYDDVDPTCERTLASLRIYSALTPDAVSNVLGIPPDDAFARGDLAIGQRTGTTRIRKFSGWFLSSEGKVESRDLRRHLDWLLSKLEPRAAGLAQLQATEGVSMNVTCIWWASSLGGGPTLWPMQMRALAELNLECSFSFSDYNNDD
jgi:hypothetical protein